MSKISLTINGKKINSEGEKTILEVVHEHGLDTIPTLCHDKRLHPFGSCFICVVEVEGMDKLVPSCATTANDGMVITTKSEKVDASRKTALDLLLSNHYADCIGPCENNCPSHVAAQNYIALISMGKHAEAVKEIKENNPLPLSIGRVCVRDCEEVCRREIVDDTLGINYLKRFAADIDANKKWTPDVKPSNGKKVAIVGGGPAGLTAAYYLVVEGFSVTILEKLPQLGGMLKYGIPEYRLPKKILDDEIKWITDLGVDVKTGVEMGKDFSTNSLLEEGYDAVFVGVGAHKASTMRLKDEEKIEGVFKGIDYLRDITTGDLPKLHGTVVIVGGGNTAIDAARNAFRWGAENVKLVYRRSIKEMPAHEEEIHAAQEEGVDMLFLTNPSAIKSENNKLTGIECLKMELKASEPGARPRPVPVEGSEFIVECDYLVGAIGQQVDTDFAGMDAELKLTKWGTIHVDEATYETSIEKVFAGGDAVSGPWTAIAAIAQGKEAAFSMIEYLNTGKAKGKKKKFFSFKHEFKNVIKDELFFAEDLPKEKMVELAPLERKFNFEEVELGLSKVQAANETARCLECGCSEYEECYLRIYADEYGADISALKGEVNEYVPDFSHPYVALDPNKCIECGRCVRTCSEKLGVSALGFVNRGLNSIVKPAMELPLLETNCVSCGNCIDTCPTGAITENFEFKNLGKSKKYDHESVCNFCSIGCKINLKLIDNDIYFVSNNTDRVSESVHDGYLCAKGRFGHRFFMQSDRIKNAFIRDNENTKSLSIEDALSESADRLNGIISKYGAESVAVFVSPKLSNEELYVSQKLAREGLKTANITSLSTLDRKNGILDGQIGFTGSTVSFSQLSKADVIVNISNSESKENLIIEYMLRKKRAEGASVLSIGKQLPFADFSIDSVNEKFLFLLKGLVKKLIDMKDPAKFSKLQQLKAEVEPYHGIGLSKLSGFDQETIDGFYSLLNGNLEKNIVFIVDDKDFQAKVPIVEMIVNYLLLNDKISKEGNGIILREAFSNALGAKWMGADSAYYPGFLKEKRDAAIGLKSKAEIKTALSSGKIKGAIVIGEDPYADSQYAKYFGDMEFVVAADISNTKTTDQADIVIPLTSYFENSGSFLSADGRLQHVPSILKTELHENWELLSKWLSKFNSDSSNELKAYDHLREEISNEVNAYTSENAELNILGSIKKAPMELAVDGEERDISVSDVPSVGLIRSEQYIDTLVSKTKNRTPQIN